jgi:hypothetical protein
MHDGHYLSSPNQTSPPELFAEPQPLSLPYSPTDLRNRLWSLDGYPYLAFCDKLPFQGKLFALLAGPVDNMLLENDRHGWHLPYGTAKLWKQLEQMLRLIAKLLMDWFQAASPNIKIFLIHAQLPSKFGYFSAHPTEDTARRSLSRSLDAFAVYLAYISFLVALSEFTSKATDTPAWLIWLENPDDIPAELSDIFKKLHSLYGKRSQNSIHPEFLNMFKDSSIVDFSGERTRTGTIVDVPRCGWIRISEVLLNANVPMWLYWGDHPLTVTPRVRWMEIYRPNLGDIFPLSPVPQPQSPPRLSACEVLARRQNAKDQRPGETYQQYFIRRRTRNEVKMETETANDKEVRANRERAAVGRECPGRKGPTVYYWEHHDNGFRVRTLQTRPEARRLWDRYSGTQLIFDSFSNEWDCCTLFGDDEPDTDGDDDIYPSTVSDVIPENATRSTLSPPPPYEESTSSLPPPHEEPTPGLPPPQLESAPILPLLHEESTSSNLSLVTSLEDQARSQEIPMDVDARSSLHEESTTSLPQPHEEPTPSLRLPHEESTPSLPPSHEESASSDLSLVTRLEGKAKSPMDFDAQSPLHEESTSSLPPLHKGPTPSLPPPHEGSTSSNLSLVTSLEVEAKSQKIPMDLDAQSLPYSPQNPVSSASSYHGHRPALIPRDDSTTHYYDRHRRNSRGGSPNRHYRRNTQNSSPERYHEHRRSRDIGYRPPHRDSRGNSPRRYHWNHSQDPSLCRDSPMRYRDRYSEDHWYYYNSDSRDGGSRSLRNRSRSRSPRSYQRSSDVMVDHPREESGDDLLTLSRAVVLFLHPPDSTILFGVQTDSLEDHVYYRFGYHLDEKTYTGVPLSASSATFRDWLEVRRSIGCHQLDGSPSCQQPIQHFFECLLSIDPLRDVPAKFWDLNVSNSAFLNLAAGFIHIEPKKFSDGITRYLIRPVGLHASRDSSWVLAVDAMTALECIRRRLGPHTIDIADFLINRGIPFSTLQRMTSIPGPRTPPRPISNHLGTRPMKYSFDLADFSVYQTVCDSFLRSNPFCRAALCMGGIVARLARENIPNTAALLGPSQDALDGLQKIMVCGDECFCDDGLSDAYKDLICGVYKVHTAHPSMYTVEDVEDVTNLNRSIFRCVLVPEAQYLGPGWV